MITACRYLALSLSAAGLLFAQNIAGTSAGSDERARLSAGLSRPRFLPQETVSGHRPWF